MPAANTTPSSTPSLTPDLTPELIAAYAATHFWVDASPRVCIKVGEQSADLLALLVRFDVDSGFFITAHKPFSALTIDADNTAANEALQQQLSAFNIPALAANGKASVGEWPAEPGFFVCGLSQAQALYLGQQFRQNAIVWCSLEKAPELLFPKRD